MEILQSLFNRLLGIEPCARQNINLSAGAFDDPHLGKGAYLSLATPACWRRGVRQCGPFEQHPARRRLPTSPAGHDL